MNAALKEIATSIKEDKKGIVKFGEEFVRVATSNAELANHLLTENVLETGTALNEIIEGVGETVERISRIATVTAKQAGHADEIGKAMCSISEVTETTVSGSEEMAASSEQLGAQATGLRELVQRFKVRTGIASGSQPQA